MPRFDQYDDKQRPDSYGQQDFYDEDLDGHGPDDDDDDDDDDSDEDDDEDEENSPIEIVAATVSTFDDPTLPCLTFRFWVIGTFFTVLGAGVSQVFYFRSNSVIFSVFFVQLMSYPIGVLMAMALPRRQFNLFGWRFSLNPGPFNMKEHMLVGVAANTGGTAAYAIDIIALERIYYRTDIGAVGAILLLITTQCIGYGMAGFVRRFLVTPANMIWPSNLVQVALYNTLHGAEPSHQGMKRQTFFMIAFVAVFLYQLLPFYVAPVLSSMAILCWILPKSPVAQMLGSGYNGLGLFNFSFDWAAVGSFGPLYTPWWAQLNFFAGVVITLYGVAPALYYTNTWDAQLYNLASADQYDEDGNEFDMSRILNDDYTVNVPKLEAYSELRMSPLFAFTYGTSFLTLTATLTHVFLYYRHSIYRQFRASRAEKEDIHTRMMRAYPNVPTSWYAGLFVSMLVVSIIVCEVYPIKLPWWGLLLAVFVAFVLTLPIGIIQAISNNRIGLNVITELICGYIYPGHPIPNVAFKVYGYMTMFQCLLLVEDMKLGHYMKIPPRKLFVVQIWGTVVGALVNYGVLAWVMEVKGKVLLGEEIDPSGQWDPRNTRIFYAASIIWGALGPARTFGPNSPYSVLLWFFLIGLVLPVPFYLLHKRFPNGKWHLVNIPIFAIGTFAVPQSPSNFVFSGFIVSFVFQYFLYRRHHGWWKRYNYVLSASLDAGTQVAAMFVFAAFANAPFPEWIGNASPSAEMCDMSLVIPQPVPFTLDD
ncbi:OPT oligopeptide transporter protein-domain-containing protein [Thamnocephalis sphaerospora]|uniref:OPT oligopeptide transporter protein-domain-containing protein n=1 Tax=Thamnocephalis sphaerospora TaxID=78915 RepID=A0A4P9XK64_9FUNG|nr:OPT oligopeptide transporter protein-domain-containing protein [Thamnocephalis sphaerospora]|eukprot:RKP06142.1 OPT oligopeptide transporter protein-domain-containing protein [Thamnocephalis sphaerospora]